MFHVEQKENNKILASPTDRLVSGQPFSVLLDEKEEVAYTHPMPEASEMDQYYLSNEYISHGNQGKTALDRLYAFAQRQMFAHKHSWFQKEGVSQGSYLDFGCGNGGLVKYLKHKGWQAIGIEPNQQARNFAGNPSFIYSSIKHIPNKKFSIVALWHVLEHLHEPDKTLKELKVRMAPNGILFVAVPNFNSWDAKHFANDWAAYDVPRHLWHFSKQGLIREVEKQGFIHQKTHPLFLDALYVSYLSSSHQNKSFALIRGIFYGIWSNILALITKEYSSNVFVFKQA